MAQVDAQSGSVGEGVAGRYASALFDLARDANAVEAVLADLTRFEQMVAESTDLQRLVRSPVFSRDELVAGLGAVLVRAGISGLSAQFLNFVASQRRLFAVMDMIASYKAMADRARGTVRAKVTLAEPASERMQAEIAKVLAEIAGSNVEVDTTIDPAIIGGIIVKIGSRMVDSSLKTKLNSLAKRMKEVG